MVKAKVWLKEKDFSGSPSIDNLKLVEEELPELKDGGTSVIGVFAKLILIDILKIEENRILLLFFRFVMT